MSNATTPVLLTWEIQMYEPFSRVWICKGHGRTTAGADPTELGQTLLASYLAGNPARHGETFRVVVRGTDSASRSTITADQLPTDGRAQDPAIRPALPVYLRESLT
ncbi:hypothetical protein ACGFX8_17720 [Streptomyces sp. NPDC048362]|uniref:hypothetical protein n=1 Tax=Streptomyces sp. NPDC048362 TaxID=3365539 RepID=UPI0037121402